MDIKLSAERQVQYGIKGRTGHTVKLLFITLTFLLPLNSHVIKTHHGCPNPFYFSRNMYKVAFVGGWSIIKSNAELF